MAGRVFELDAESAIEGEPAPFVERAAPLPRTPVFQLERELSERVAALESHIAHLQEYASGTPLHPAGTSSGHRGGAYRLPATAPEGRLMTALEAREAELKRNTMRLRRQVGAQRHGAASAELHAKKLAAADAVREEKRMLAGKNVVDITRGEPPASEEMVHTVASLLNTRLRQVFVDPLERGWFKLFRQVDIDGSGLISFFEFTKMVRRELKLTTRQLPEASLRGVWMALDTDGSGHVTAGEFGKVRPPGSEPGSEPGSNPPAYSRLPVCSSRTAYAALPALVTPPRAALLGSHRLDPTAWIPPPGSHRLDPTDWIPPLGSRCLDPTAWIPPPAVYASRRGALAAGQTESKAASI